MKVDFYLLKNLVLAAFVVLTCITTSTSINAQATKQIHRQDQLWLSLNSTIKFSPKWGMVGDLHLRRNNFAENPSFYFIRFGADYWINKQVSAIVGYGHMWVANPIIDAFVFTNENRIYQQVQYAGKLNKTGLLLRIRNEQRWQEKLVNGVKSGNNRFTNRVRYLTSVNFKLFKNPKLPRLMIADEILVHFGKEVVLNTFDQNRLTIGIQQKISKTVSFDLGYMMVYQQKYTGFQYDLNNTARLFFYWTPDFGKMQKTSLDHPHLSGDE
ncbi:MAG: DUF2490 domain-containing protein [Bacteroidota bacterium]